jgi:oligopeptide/dipeptide ABC transporter ATP-binding protein
VSAPPLADAGAVPLLEVDDLRVAFPTRRGLLYAVDGVSFSIGPGEVLGIVGESGSGKSVTCRAILGLVPAPGAILGGQVRLAGRDLVGMRPRHLRALRGRDVAMVFQDPRSALNPVFTIGHQIVEVLTQRRDYRRPDARTRAIELLDRVGIPAPAKRMDAYSHELSGGMRQRVMIALALAGEPRLLIADEPTTALDVTIQDQILHLLLELRSETGMSVILVSHDLGVIAQTCDHVAVMYAGRLVEKSPVDTIFRAPAHPYTRALLDAIPRLHGAGAGDELRPIPGQPPDLAALPPGCVFAPRCPLVRPGCEQVTMELVPISPGHESACPFVLVDGASAA